MGIFKKSKARDDEHQSQKIRERRVYEEARQAVENQERRERGMAQAHKEGVWRATPTREKVAIRAGQAARALAPLGKFVNRQLQGPPRQRINRQPSRPQIIYVGGPVRQPRQVAAFGNPRRRPRQKRQKAASNWLGVRPIV